MAPRLGFVAVAAWILALLGAGECAAQETKPAIAAAAVGDRALDALRGGFDDGRGLTASFGIERVVSINGAVVTSQSVQIADLSRISAVQASQLQSVLGGVNLVRNGAGNSFALPPMQSLAGATVIQNTLDDQTIKSLTVINATTNSLRLLQGVNATASLRDALLAPLAPRP